MSGDDYERTKALYTARNPCPRCGREQNIYEASGSPEETDFRLVAFASLHPDHHGFRCIGCGVTLHMGIPFETPSKTGWGWMAL